MKTYCKLMAVLAGMALAATTLAAENRVKIVLVGDSTVADRTGWGLGFLALLDTNHAECINVAMGGRSSLSFLREGRWTNALALKGNYYLLQFGHNNQPGKPGRSTDLPTFVANLRQYVDEARALGATPVLVTPLTRRQWDAGHPGKIKSTLEPYAQAIRQLAAEAHVPLVDLHARSLELCEQLGPENCRAFSPVKVVNGTNDYDNTHLRGPGRVLFAGLVVAALRQAVPQLAPCLLAEPRVANPTMSEDVYDAVVSHDFSADYKDLQSAINAAPDHGRQPFRLLLKPGVYEGQFIVPEDKPQVQIIGEDVTNTILTYALNVNETNANTNPQFKGTGVIVLGDDFHADHLTFQNTSGDHGQALALRVDGDRARFNHCRLLGWQDTLRLNHARQYFTNCYLEGRVDFIYGSATAVFDRCEIHSKNGGHVTAASTPPEQPLGFVFLDCRLTGDPTPWLTPTNANAEGAKKPLATLGRPWRPHASVTYVRCEIGGHIAPRGWDNWRNPTNELTARFAEYHSTGPGAHPEARCPWAKQLTEEAASQLTVEKILGGADAWRPDTE